MMELRASFPQNSRPIDSVRSLFHLNSNIFRCCPANCVVSSWGQWSACNVTCEQTGNRTRTRTIVTPASCGGSCPEENSLIENGTCYGPCCPRDCLLSNWSSWQNCTAPVGMIQLLSLQFSFLAGKSDLDLKSVPLLSSNT